MPEDLRERIFESGFAIKTAPAAEGAGLGLGLALARGLVAQHHGRIEVGYVPEGGAAFTVHRPTAGQ